MSDIKAQPTIAADMDAIAWDERAMSYATGINERTIQRWYAGNEAPEHIAAWLHTLAEFHRANPVPVKENVS